MANQYMSLAKALHTYGKSKATKIPQADGDKCSSADMNKIEDLMSRGYRYISVEPGDFTADEVEHQSSRPVLLKVEEASWSKSKGNIPFQSYLNDPCTDPTQSTEDQYGWHFKDTYFYSESFSWYGGRRGRV